jgi:aldose 1-epimerase
LTWTAEAVSDASTIVNFVHHPYWNLAGGEMPAIDGHVFQLFAAYYLPLTDGEIPTGEIRSVAGTPMDFRQPRAVRNAEGLDYDHCWVLDRSAAADDLALAARLSDPRSGRMLEVSTNQPGIQFYDWSVMDGSVTGRSGQNYGPALVSASNHKTSPTLRTTPIFPRAAWNPAKCTLTALYTSSHQAEKIKRNAWHAALSALSNAARSGLSPSPLGMFARERFGH